MRQFQTIIKEGNVVEKRVKKGWEMHLITKEDINLQDNDLEIFNLEFRPAWINRKNLRLIGFDFITYFNQSDFSYYEEYQHVRQRKLYTLQVWFEIKNELESVSYKLMCNFDNLCNKKNTRNLYLHDLQNLIELYEND